MGDDLCKSPKITTTIQLIDIDDNDPIIQPNNSLTTITIKENENLEGLNGFFVTDADSELNFASFDLSIRSNILEAQEQIQLFQTSGYQRADIVFKLDPSSDILNYDKPGRDFVEFELLVKGPKSEVSKPFRINLEVSLPESMIKIVLSF